MTATATMAAMMMMMAHPVVVVVHPEVVVVHPEVVVVHPEFITMAQATATLHIPPPATTRAISEVEDFMPPVRHDHGQRLVR